MSADVHRLRVLAAQARRVCLAGLVALTVLFAWQTLFAWPQELGVRLSVFVVQLLPFLLVLPGLLSGRWRSYAWMLLFLQLYFVVATLRLFEQPAAATNWLLLVLLLLVFTAALLFVRWTRVAQAHGA